MSGFDVSSAKNISDATALTEEKSPDYAIVDLCIGQESGLTMVKTLANINSDMRIVVLTGYASIAAAVEAIKLGATHYLTKPTDVDEIIEAFSQQSGNTSVQPSASPCRLKDWNGNASTNVATKITKTTSEKLMTKQIQTIASPYTSLYTFLFIFLVFFTNHVSAASPYKLNMQNELIYLGTGATLALTGYYNERNRKAPSEADLAALNKSDIPGFERQYAGKWNEDAHKLSDVMLATGVLSPLLFLSQEDFKKDDYFTLGVMYLETFGLTSGGMALSKGSVTRYRPLAYGDKAPLSERLKHETKRSFFSGHTALTASGLFFTASVFSDYYPDSKYNTAIWATAITGSVATGMMRIKAGKHFPTDVITGLAWGGAVGYLIPQLHKKERGFILFPFTNNGQLGIYAYKGF